MMELLKGTCKVSHVRSTVPHMYISSPEYQKRDRCFLECAYKDPDRCPKEADKGVFNMNCFTSISKERHIQLDKISKIDEEGDKEPILFYDKNHG